MGWPLAYGKSVVEWVAGTTGGLFQGETATFRDALMQNSGYLSIETYVRKYPRVQKLLQD